MRAVLILLGLCLGLVIALPFGVRMSHLRALAPDWIPAAAASITDDSRIVAGTWNEAIPGVPLALQWRLVPDSPFTADLTLTGPATAMRAQALWPPNGEVIALSDIRGQIGLESWARDAQLRIEGAISVQDGSASVQVSDGRLRRLAGQVHATGLVLDGVEIGLVSAEIVPDAIGWQAPLVLNGPTFEGTGTLQGRYAEPNLYIALALAATGDVPDNWRAFLDTFGSKTETGWTIEQRIDMRRLLPTP